MKAPRTEAEIAAEKAFIARALAMVKERLYVGMTDVAFDREKLDLILAISEPAAYLKARHLKLPGRRYLAILGEVIDGIAKHGDFEASRYKPQYLRKCLQLHMQVRGETYLEEAKAAELRDAGRIAVALVKKIKPVADGAADDSITDTLVAARALIESTKRPRNGSGMPHA